MVVVLRLAGAVVLGLNGTSMQAKHLLDFCRHFYDRSSLRDRIQT